MLRDKPMSTVLPAEDIHRAKKFYSEKLGLQPLDMPVPEDGAAFKSGDGAMLYLYEKEGGTKADHTVGMWLVDDIEKAVDKMSEKGVTFEKFDMPGLKTDERGIAEDNGAKSAWFKDSEGNTLAITEVSQ